MPSSASPQPHITPSPYVGLVWLWLVPQALKHMQNMGPKPQKHNQPLGISWAHLTLIPTIPNLCLHPLWGCLCPPSLLLPLSLIHI